MIGAIRIVLATLTVQALLLLAVGYLGAVLPLADSVAVFRLQISALVTLGALAMLFTGSRVLAPLLLVVAGLSAAPILYGFMPLSAAEPGPYVLYQKNLSKKELSRAVLTRDILSFDPDFLTLQEITEHDLRYMAGLFDRYEHQVICKNDSAFNVGLLSRYPLVPGSEICPDEQRVAAAQVQLPDGSRLWLISLHLGWPYPAGQHEQSVIISDWLEGIEGPILIGGDFNMVPWGSAVRRISKAARVTRAGPYFGTFPESGPLFPLPIDHIMLPPGAKGRAEPRPRVGSDHLGILARFSL